MNQKKEIKALTGIRGIAALYVALYHSLENKQNLHPSLFERFANRGYLAVDLFFILSGFVITLSSKKYFEDGFSPKNYKDFMKKRFARVYPMYFIILISAYIFFNHFGGTLNFIIGLSMLNILYSPGWVILHLWSLSAEWVAYLCYPFLFKFTYLKKSLFWSAIVVVIGSFAIFLYIRYNYLYIGNQAASKGLTDVVKCFAEYLLGIVAFKLVDSFPKLLPYRIFLSFVSFLCIIPLLFFNTTDFFIILLFFPLVIGLSSDKGLLNMVMASRLVYFLGLISYSLYLIHPMFLHLFKKYFYSQYGERDFTVLIFNSIYFASIIVGAFLTFKFIELPMQKFLNNKFRSRTMGLDLAKQQTIL